MKKLLTGAISLALLCPFPLPAQAKPTVHCAKPQRGGVGLTALVKDTIAASVGSMTLRELISLAKPPCIRNAVRSDPNNSNVTITFLYASDHLTDRVYVVTVDHGIVTNLQTEMLSPADYVTKKR